MDVKELFEAQIPIGPEHRPMTERIAVGRRALRRRRRASVGAASVAVVAVVGIVGTVVNVGDLRSDRDDPPTTNTPAPPDEELTNAIPVATDWLECTEDWDKEPNLPLCFDDMVRIGDQGVLRRRDGVQINQRVDDPVTESTIEMSVALEATYHGETRWFYLEHGEHGGVLLGEPGDKPTFRDWVAELSPLTPPGHRYPELKDTEGVTRVGTAWYDADELVIREDAEVVERIDNPLGYADEDDSVALAAKVDGVEWWTLLGAGPASHTDMQRAGSGDFQAWVDAVVKRAYSAENNHGVAFDANGKVVSTSDRIRVVDQIVDPDIDWIKEPGEHSALVEYTFVGDGPGGRNFTLVRTRNALFEGAIESISFRYHPERDTLQTVLAKLQKEDRS